VTISPEYAEELGRQVDELEAENERLREFSAWVDTWVSNPATSYSVYTLDGLFGMTRDKLAALAAPQSAGNAVPPQEASEQFATQQPDGSVRLDAYAGKTREELKAQCRKLSMVLMDWQFTAANAAIAGGNKLENLPEPHFSKLRKFIDAYSDDGMLPTSPPSPPSTQHKRSEMTERAAHEALVAALKAWDAYGGFDTWEDTSRKASAMAEAIRSTLASTGLDAALAAQPPEAPVAWRVKNDFGHWHVTQDKALADTYRDVEKKDVQPLYHLPDLPKTVWMPIETAPKGPTISVARKGGQRDDGTTYWYQAVGHYDPNLGHFHKQYGELYGEPELWALYPENPERCSTLSHPKPPSTDS